MVHSGVYLNKYVVSIAPFSTPACPIALKIFIKLLFLHVFAIYFFRPFFQVGSADPIYYIYVHKVDAQRIIFTGGRGLRLLWLRPRV